MIIRKIRLRFWGSTGGRGFSFAGKVQLRWRGSLLRNGGVQHFALEAWCGE